HFTALMDELSASENKLFQERRRYNDAVAAWNVKIKQFPTVIVASMFGKTERPFFEARPGADEPPVVSFD
ncbi:MAG: LemA family protein, partial [Limnochordia bacterium]